MVDVCLLGCGGMMPLPHRRLTAMLYRYRGRMILIDCGEGTQIPIKMTGWGFKSIEAICFTHYHADHIAGLPGLLLTLGNSNRTEPLTLLGPPGLREVVEGLTVIVPALPFIIKLAELPDTGPALYRAGETDIKSIPADHTVSCLAYSLETKRPGRFDPKKAQSLGIPKEYWKHLQNGEVVEWDGDRFEPDMVLGKRRKGLKVAYCTDTRPTEELTNFCENADLFICEGIYGENEKQPGAMEKKHMIFSEAAALAKKSGAAELWLTHYSPALADPCPFLINAKSIFANTQAGQDLMMKRLFYEK